MDPERVIFSEEEVEQNREMFQLIHLVWNMAEFPALITASLLCSLFVKTRQPDVDFSLVILLELEDTIYGIIAGSDLKRTEYLAIKEADALASDKKRMIHLAFSDVKSANEKKGNLEPTKLVKLAQEVEKALSETTLTTRLFFYWLKANSRKTYVVPDKDATVDKITANIHDNFRPTDFSTSIFRKSAMISRTTSPIGSFRERSSLIVLIRENIESLQALICALLRSHDWAQLSDFARLLHMMILGVASATTLEVLDRARGEDDEIERAKRKRKQQERDDDGTAMFPVGKSGPRISQGNQITRLDNLQLALKKLIANVCCGHTRIEIRSNSHILSIAFVTMRNFTEVRISQLTGETTQFGSKFFDLSALECLRGGKKSMKIDDFGSPEIILYAMAVNSLLSYFVIFFGSGKECSALSDLRSDVPSCTNRHQCRNRKDSQGQYTSCLCWEKWRVLVLAQSASTHDVHCHEGNSCEEKWSSFSAFIVSPIIQAMRS